MNSIEEPTIDRVHRYHLTGFGDQSDAANFGVRMTSERRWPLYDLQRSVCNPIA